MALYILDPNLDRPNGHHLAWDQAIARAARDFDLNVTIFTHRDFAEEFISNVTVVPHFSHTTYETLNRNESTAEYDDFHNFNEILVRELSALDSARFVQSDIVLVPTCTENHLFGFVRWMMTFDPRLAPMFVIHLLFAPHRHLHAEPKLPSYSEIFYQLPFVAATFPGPRILFFGAGLQVCRRIATVIGRQVEPFPIPLSPERNDPVNSQRPATLLFAGDAKIEKGFLLLDVLAKTLCEKYPERDFIVHTNPLSTNASIVNAQQRLVDVSSQYENLTLRSGWLDSERYYALFAQVDCAVICYDPDVYAEKTSGIVWECISLGIPLLVPSGTWAEHEAEEWGAGYECFTSRSVRGISQGFTKLLTNHLPLTVQSKRAAAQFRSRNGPTQTVEHILRQWLKEAMIRPESSSTDPGVAAQFVTLNALSRTDLFRHLDLSLFNVFGDGTFRPHVRFKLAIARGICELEFRKGPEWPSIFHAWPGASVDQYGPVTRLRGTDELASALRRWSDTRDRSLLAAIAALLPNAVAAAQGATPLAAHDRQEWLDTARVFSKTILAELEACT